MQKKIEKSLARFRAMPQVHRVDLEVKAVLQQEDLRGQKIDMERLHPKLLEGYCLNYLRHTYFTDYERHCQDLAQGDYLKMYEEFTEAVSANYPWLAQEAHHRLFWKRKDARDSKQHPLDNRLNQILLRGGVRVPIANWRWYGAPTLFKAPVTIEKKELSLKVMEEIVVAQKEVCATSSSSYVRGCKTWLEEKLPFMEHLVKASQGELAC